MDENYEGKIILVCGRMVEGQQSGLNKALNVGETIQAGDGINVDVGTVAEVGLYEEVRIGEASVHIFRKLKGNLRVVGRPRERSSIV